MKRREQSDLKSLTRLKSINACEVHFLPKVLPVIVSIVGEKEGLGDKWKICRTAANPVIRHENAQADAVVKEFA